jgi:hypothetical protein
MERKCALKCRKLKVLTPYSPKTWEANLIMAGLFDRYSHIPERLHQGFCVDIPKIDRTQTPPNKESIVTYQQEFYSIIQSELEKGRYIGTFTAHEVKDLIGPFQSSPY